ncbi:MAG: ADP-ribosylglycohydrolase family protein [Candidatus Krumholzibacteria bacterium]|nr:ADP-ribosylglycohydrolase family protein [Candidatus Krumholzibacteria bacterium]MDH4338384.1 ADP-ribosylglycohydrolase family protein [Candidatus Krumholzibacteria bacterium]MDH5270857.1 ADP-ribosylglycohydrolase family protein [Candidatus Krumholzibacteria bacterium]
MSPDAPHVDRAKGCLLGQLCGDALGAIVEFGTPENIRLAHPGGLREMIASPVFNTLPGQITDDSEMALALARSLVATGSFDVEAVRAAYVAWMDSGPFDVGKTVAASLYGFPNPDSQANGALMRISPLGIFGARHSLDDVARWAREDAAMTHVHPVCPEASALFATAISDAVQTGAPQEDIYARVLERAHAAGVNENLLRAVTDAAKEPPADYLHKQGWVMIAIQNAFWHLLKTHSLEEAIVETVMRGGDTDTNAAICGALLGAVHGRAAIPRTWEKTVLNCRPQAGVEAVRRPRPRTYWATDALELAEQLAGN